MMKKQIDVYFANKEKNDSKIYLFKSGIFYYFLDEDAKYISQKYNFKLTAFGKNVKCGFPVKSLEKYLYIFSKEDIEVITDNNDSNSLKIVSILENIDLNEITPHKAYLLLSEMKELV